MRHVLTCLFALLFTWLAGLAWFSLILPSEPASPRIRTDAIVVLTGGKGRVERGFSLLAQKSAPLLFISGVGKEVTLQEMIEAHTSTATRERIYATGGSIMLGHQASTTQTNAEEVAAFVRLKPVRSIRLVTANYHMPRSLREFTQAMPEVTFITDPVFPDDFRKNDWWQHENTRRLMLLEYHKFLAVGMRPYLP